MRDAHLQILDHLDPGKGDPTSFERFVEKVRNHLFDLTRIGEGANPDIVARVSRKLSVHERLALNEFGRSTRVSDHLNTFGSWLCDRAANYQNPYDVAAAQPKAEPSRNRRQVHHQNLAARSSWNRERRRWVNGQEDHHLENATELKKRPRH